MLECLVDEMLFCIEHCLQLGPDTAMALVNVDI